MDGGQKTSCGGHSGGIWHNKLDRFDTVDAFLEKLRELNKRDYVKLTISLESINYELYHDEIKVPKYLDLDNVS